MTSNYRPIAPNNLDQVVAGLELLSTQTILPWKFDARKKQFYVEEGGKKSYIRFEEGDAETEIVLAMSNNLPLILAALYNRFYFMTGDAHGRQPVRRGSQAIQG